jgi:hypothetical protein
VNDIAADVVRFLAPFVPFLVRAGEDAAQEAARRFGSDAWERAKQLWLRIGAADEETWQDRAAEAAADPASATEMVALLRDTSNVTHVRARTVTNVVTGVQMTFGAPD